MTHTICYVNGRYLPLNEAALSVQDLAILRGYGVFDFLRTYNGQPFRLPEHLSRLAHSARLIELELPRPLVEIEQIVLEVLRRNVLPEANIRIVVTGGVSGDSVTSDTGPGLLVLLTPPRRYPETYYQTGVKVITVETERYIPQAKTINYIPALLALKKARAVGAVEALYVNRAGHILEGTTTNLFILQEDRLITPADDILPGITRNVVLELARAGTGYEVIERPITFADVAQANEAFITASNKEIMPVRVIDDQAIGRSTPGPHTRQLMARFWQLTRGNG